MDSYDQRIVAKFMKRRFITPTGCWELINPAVKSYTTTRYYNEKIGLHVLMLMLFKPNEWRWGLQANHTCNNKKCWNPDHLYAGTQSENIIEACIKNQNSKKTHCMYGHEFTDDNIYWDNGNRHCKTCKKEYDKQRRMV